MTVARTVIAALLGAALLGGCGGGGGGDTKAPVGGSPPPANPAPPVSPAPPVPQPAWRITGGSGPLEAMADEGRPTSLIVSAGVEAVPGETVQAAVVDAKGLVTQVGAPLFNGHDEFIAHLATATALTPGEHETTLELRICRDDPLVCKAPIAGSPWRVALKVKAGSQGKLTALAPVSGLPSWSSYNGNAAHTGHVPASFNVAAFTRRWSLPGNEAMRVYPPAIDNGRVFVTRRDKAGAWELLAIDEASGETAWRRRLDGFGYVNPPAASNGNVYFTATEGTQSWFYVLSQINGAAFTKVPIGTPVDQFRAPAVAGDMVYTPVGSGGASAILKLNWRTNQVEWTGATLPYRSYWTPAVDDGHAYAFLDRSLYAFRTSDGGTAYEIPVQDANVDTSATDAPLVGGGRAFIARSMRLLAFDLQTRTLAWSKPTSSGPQPALANGVLYVAPDVSRVEALDAATGAQLWGTRFWIKPRDDYFQRLIVSNNLAFAVGWKSITALDLATRQIAWTYPLGGEPAISDRGVLYILSPDGRLDAINLR